MNNSVGHIDTTANGSSDMMMMSFLKNQLRPQIEKEIKAEYEATLREKNKKIQDLEHEIEFLKTKASFDKNIGTITTTQTIQRKYQYNTALFEQNQGEIIIEALIKLAGEKREGGKYLIANKTDWFFAYKLLYRKSLFFGSQEDFCQLINECVISGFETGRRKKLELKTFNFTTIPEDSIVKKNKVDFWREEFRKEKQKQIEDNKQTRTKYLERAINIVDVLQAILKGTLPYYSELSIL